MAIPDDLAQRPLELGDAAAVAAVMAAEELRDTGEVSIEEADLLGDWQRPGFDLAASTLGVFDGDDLVAYAEHSGGARADAAVHPDHHGRGVGSHLAAWLQETARAAGSSAVGMQVPDGSPGDRLLEQLGFEVRWTSWVLALPEGRVVDAQPLPDGYALRAARDEDHHAVWTVLEDAFLEWSDRELEPFDDFAATVMRRPGFEPWNLRVVTDPDGVVVGASFVVFAHGEGYVDKIGVRKDQRGRGLARALLADSFAQARQHGATRSTLATDTRTGALGLYEKVGMEVTQTWFYRAIDLERAP
ncbi:MAG: GNAT family N-acetyltransferase [Acidimicrobiales bacterium]